MMKKTITILLLIILVIPGSGCSSELGSQTQSIESKLEGSWKTSGGSVIFTNDGYMIYQQLYGNRYEQPYSLQGETLRVGEEDILSKVINHEVEWFPLLVGEYSLTFSGDNSLVLRNIHYQSDMDYLFMSK